MTDVFNFDVDYPYQCVYIDSVLISESENGYEQRRRKWSTGKKRWSLRSGNLAQATADNMASFFENSVNGQYRSFYFSDWNDYITTSEAVGTGDASTVAFSLDKQYIASTTDIIAVGGAAKTRNVDYTIDNDTGVVTFLAAPGNGSAVTAGYQFYHLVRLDGTPQRTRKSYLVSDFAFDFVEVFE